MTLNTPDSHQATRPVGYIRWVVIFPLLLLFLPACGRSPLADEPRIDARAWLLENRNLSALASNRFETTAAALRFVNRLYGAGAESVLVSGIRSEPWRLEAEGGPYASTLVVVLPQESQKREELFRLSNREAAREGLAVEQDHGQRQLVLWWD